MRRWKEDVRGVAGLNYIIFKNVPMRESKWGDVVDMQPSLMEKLAAEAIIARRVPLHGREVKFLRKALFFSYEKLGSILGISPSTLCKWEQKPDERLHAFNEAALRAFFAEQLGVEIPGKFSELIGTEKTPRELVLKAG